MGIFSGTVKGSNPMTMGGKGAKGSGKNMSPYKLADQAFSQSRSNDTRSLAKKFSSSLNTDRSLSKPVTNAKAAIKAQ